MPAHRSVRASHPTATKPHESEDGVWGIRTRKGIATFPAMSSLAAALLHGVKVKNEHPASNVNGL
jgi:hypothetical protein